MKMTKEEYLLVHKRTRDDIRKAKERRIEIMRDVDQKYLSDNAKYNVGDHINYKGYRMIINKRVVSSIMSGDNITIVYYCTKVKNDGTADLRCDDWSICESWITESK